MKRYLLLTISLVINILAIASSPKLASEKFFDDLDVYDSTLSITIVERKDQTVRSVSFKNKPDLLKKIQKALASDKEKASRKSFVTDDGEISESVVINNEDEDVKIGLITSKSKEVYFFIKVRHHNNRRGSKKTSRNTQTSKSKKSTKTEKSSKTEKSGDFSDFDDFSDFNDFINDFINDFAEFSFEMDDAIQMKF